MGESFAVLLIFLIVVIVLISSLKIAAEDERFAVFVLGRFGGFKGPGLVFVVPQTQKAHKLKVGEVGVLKSSEFAEFGGVAIPVTGTAGLTNGQAVRIDKFDGPEPVLVASSDHPQSICPKCGHQY